MKTLKNKLVAFGFFLMGIIGAIVSGGDLTLLIFLGCFAIPMLFARVSWFD